MSWFYNAKQILWNSRYITHPVFSTVPNTWQTWLSHMGMVYSSVWNALSLNCSCLSLILSLFLPCFLFDCVWNKAHLLYHVDQTTHKKKPSQLIATLIVIMKMTLKDTALLHHKTYCKYSKLVCRLHVYILCCTLRVLAVIRKWNWRFKSVKFIILDQCLGISLTQMFNLQHGSRQFGKNISRRWYFQYFLS